jgi:hypothetical protein
MKNPAQLIGMINRAGFKKDLNLSSTHISSYSDQMLPI